MIKHMCRHNTTQLSTIVTHSILKRRFMFANRRLIHKMVANEDPDSNAAKKFLIGTKKEVSSKNFRLGCFVATGDVDEI